MRFPALRALAGVAFVAALVLPGCGGKTKTVTVPATAPTTQTAPATSYERYRARRYTAEVPSGWTQEADQQRHTSYVESRWRDPSDPNTSITIDATANDTASPGVSAAGVRAATRRAPGYRELAFEPAGVAGRGAWKWTFQISGDQRVDYFLNDCATGVAVLGSTAPGRFSRLQATFAHVADSVSIACSAPTPGPGTTTTTTTTTTAAPSQTCRIKAWYSGTGFSADHGYIHFKCVDEQTGKTVAEALGSDSIDFRQESQTTMRTARREELVAKLRSQLESDGWRQIGTVSGGEWYQLRFGR